MSRAVWGSSGTTWASLVMPTSGTSPGHLRQEAVVVPEAVADAVPPPVEGEAGHERQDEVGQRQEGASARGCGKPRRWRS